MSTVIPQRVSLVEQTARLIREHIVNGLWRDILPGEIEMAEKFKISRVTLRAALDELKAEGWFRGTQGKRRSINRYLATKSLPPPASTTVVLLSPVSLHNMPSSRVVRLLTLKEHFGAVGYELDIHCSQACYSQHPERALEALAGRVRPAGWVLYLSTAPMQRWFFERRLNCVISGSCHPNVDLPSIDLDYTAICRHAVGKFAAKGYKRIALVIPFSDQAGNLESERGFMEGGGQFQHQGVEVLIVHHAGTVEALCRVIDGLVSGPRPVTGLLVAKPAHAITTICHLLRRGICIPEAVGVISRDDDFSLEPVVPVISRYRIDSMLYARKVARVVVQMVHHGTRRNKAHRLLPELLQGETF